MSSKKAQPHRIKVAPRPAQQSDEDTTDGRNPSDKDGNEKQLQKRDVEDPAPDAREAAERKAGEQPPATS